jgi:hypothetical protein
MPPFFIALVNNSGYLNQKIQGREQEKGIQKKMRIKVAAKLLVIAWTLMKEHKYFNAEQLRLS